MPDAILDVHDNLTWTFETEIHALHTKTVQTACVSTNGMRRTAQLVWVKVSGSFSVRLLLSTKTGKKTLLLNVYVHAYFDAPTPSSKLLKCF